MPAFKTVAPLLILFGFLSGPANAAEWRWGGKLDLTRGVTSIEGAGGGGLASWALISGNETVDGIGANASATLVHVPNYDLRAFGGAIGLFDRAEVSYEHQNFDTGATG